MARLPSQLTYNDLNGTEAVEILTDWFKQLLRSHPQMQAHLTLPMACFTLNVSVGVDMYIGGTVPVASAPEHMDIAGSVGLTNNVAAGSLLQAADNYRDVLRAGPVDGAIERTVRDFKTVVNAAPVAGGSPPDQIREQHNLHVPRPGYGDRDTGRHLYVGDHAPDLNATGVFRTSDTTISPVPHQGTDRATRTATVPDTSTTGGRRGDVAEGYVFSSETVGQVLKQTLPVDNGRIQVDLAGDGIQHAGIHVSAGTHVSSKKTLGDQGGNAYESVNGVYDPGPRGLMRPGRGEGGYGSDGRPRISFGNNQRG